MNDDLKVPQHFRFINPILNVLRGLGGSGKAGEVSEKVVEIMDIPETELEETIPSGQPKIYNQIAWARLFLCKLDYLDASTRGVWALTEKGLEATFTDKDLYDLYKKRKSLLKETDKTKTKSDTVIKPTVDPIGLENIEKPNYRTLLIEVLKSLSPNGFERICQRLLRESNFEQVQVTGRSGDGGIDGIGLLQMNSFVSFSVLFQCKRYQGTVPASQVRDFRGAMMGRADKGIIMTTGHFSTDAKKEARRDGVPPIELVDGEKMLDMFEQLELGLKPIKTYEIDEKFFEEFRQ